MARTESQMLELGTEAPPFSLPDPDGNLHSLVDGKAAYLVMFICNHCPFVIHVREELARLGRDYLDRGVQIVAISSNDVETHPADAPDKMKEEAKQAGYPFPYLYRGESLQGGLHAGLLPVRCRPQTGLPGPTRRQPPVHWNPGHR